MSWIGAWIGLLCRSVESPKRRDDLAIPRILRGQRVRLSTKPTGPLRTFAEWNPISAVANTTRSLFGNPVQPPGIPPATNWPAQHAALYALLTALAIIAVFMPLALARYRRVASH